VPEYKSPKEQPKKEKTPTPDKVPSKKYKRYRCFNCFKPIGEKTDEYEKIDKGIVSQDQHGNKKCFCSQSCLEKERGGKHKKKVEKLKNFLEERTTFQQIKINRITGKNTTKTVSPILELLK